MAKTMKRLIALAALMVAVSVAAEPACYTADAESGELRFSGVAEGTPFRGRFGSFNVRICLDGDDLTSAEIEVNVRTGSADVGNRDGNQALRDKEFFAVDRFPEAYWASTEIIRDGDGYSATGELSIKSVSGVQNVALVLKTDDEPWVLAGSAEIFRLDWNVGIGEFEDPDFIRNRVDLQFELKLQEESGT